MLAIAHYLAITCYIGAAGLAAAPFARPMRAPVRGVTAILALGVGAHVVGLASFAQTFGQLPLMGIGPALSVAGLLVAGTLLLVELLAGEVSLTLAAAPFAAVATIGALAAGLAPYPAQAVGAPGGGAWVLSHVALSFVGFAAFATAAAAGTMYLVERRELKSRRFGAIFRFFPPLETLDRVNHVAAVAGWIALTLGVALAVSYSVSHEAADVTKALWGISSWAAVTTLTVGRVLGGWSARRAALVTTVSFSAVVVLYVVFRMTAPHAGRFL
jgi:HemX protein